MLLPLMPALCIHALDGEVSVIRRTTTIEKGYAVSAEAAPIEIEAVVHPATGRMVERQAQGLECREVIQVFTSFDLRCELDCDEPDILLHRPRKDMEPVRYVVYKSEDWAASSGAGHIRALAYREPKKGVAP